MYYERNRSKEDYGIWLQLLNNLKTFSVLCTGYECGKAVKNSCKDEAEREN